MTVLDASLRPVQELLDSAPDPTGVLTPAGILVLVNPALERLLAACGDEPAVRDLAALLSEGDRARLFEYLAERREAARGACPGIEVSLVTARGTLPVVMRANPLAESYGPYLYATFEEAPGGAAGAWHRGGEGRLPALLDELEDVVVWSVELPAKRVVFLNRAAERLYGRPYDELVRDADHWLTAMHPEDRAALQPHLDLLRRAGAHAWEYRVVRPDGTIRWVLAQPRLQRSTDGRLERVEGIASDITWRKQRERQQEAVSSGLQATLAAADELLACPDVDTTLRRAVELARERLGMERCAIFREARGEVVGTFGTDSEGRTTDERAVRIPKDAAWSRWLDRCERGAKRWTIQHSAQLTEWDGQGIAPVATGWVAATTIQSWEGPVGVFFNDNACTGNAVDSLKQDLLAVYCSLLGNIVQRKQLEEELRATVSSAGCLLWRAVVEEKDGELCWETELSNEEAACHLFGLAPGTGADSSLRTATEPDDWPRMHRTSTAALRAGVPGYVQEYRYRRSDGEVRWLAEDARITPLGAGRWRVVGVCTDITERKCAEERLRDSEERYRSLVDNASDLVYSHDVEGHFISFNRAATELTGYTEEEVLRMKSTDLVAPEFHDLLRERAGVRRAGFGGRSTCELELVRKDGSRLPVEVSSTAVCRDGRVIAVQGIARDITERQRLEAQLRQSQKMEAVGRLAGGVAHDFNNMLAVINGYSEILLARLPEDEPTRQGVGDIKKAGERAASLTRQLLAFSRKQILAPRPVDAAELLLDLNKMLRRLIGEDVELVTVLAPDTGRVLVDPGQLEQVVLNLAVNARDAMPRGGRLTLRTANAELTDLPGSVVRGAPGPYVLIEVSDTGCGMAPETLSHLFEPFFTTKEPGQGTGLGLATVYGIVQQSGGALDVTSAPGEGATFRVYLPRVENAPPERAEAPDAPPPAGKETVLLVEDEEMVRRMVRAVLLSQGYRVLDAPNAAAALELFREGTEPIDLLLTDVVMPQISGRELAETLRAGSPDLRVLFMSGYSDDAVFRHGVRSADAAFIQKPFKPLDLARKLREVLDSPARRAAAMG